MVFARFRVLAASVALLLALAGPARADQTDQRLAGLFAQLKATEDPAAAAPLEAEIWSIWTESGKPDVDAAMRDGAAAMTDSDLPRALSVYDRVVALAPDFAEGWNKRATTLYLMGRFNESVADIARVLALEPRHFGALSGLGLCETQLDRLPQAVAAFEQALAVDPAMVSARENIRALKAELAKRAI